MTDYTEWFLEEAKSKLWISGAIKKKGALRSQLGIKEGEKIPKSLLRRISKAKVGTKISFRGKSITVTAKLKKRAVLAMSLGKMHTSETEESNLVEWFKRLKEIG